MTMHVNVSGAWKAVATPSVKVSGAAKTVAAAYVRVSGAWKEFFSAVAATTHTLTSAVDAIGPYVVTGYSNGGDENGVAFGSLSSPTDPSGRTINDVFDADDGGGTTFAAFNVEGNATGATFTSVVVGGVTRARTSADVAAGTYDATSNSTSWTWASAPWGISGNPTVTVNP